MHTNAMTLALAAVLTLSLSIGLPSARAETFEVSTASKKGLFAGSAQVISFETENGNRLACEEFAVSGDLKEGTGIAGNEVGLVLMAAWNKETETCDGGLLGSFGFAVETLVKPWTWIAHGLLNNKDLIDGLLHITLTRMTGGCGLLILPGLLPAIYHNVSQLLLLGHAVNLLAAAAGWGEDTLKVSAPIICGGFYSSGESIEFETRIATAPAGADVLIR